MATDVGAAASVIEDGRNGYLVKDNNPGALADRHGDVAVRLYDAGVRVDGKQCVEVPQVPGTLERPALRSASRLRSYHSRGKVGQLLSGI